MVTFSQKTGMGGHGDSLGFIQEAGAYGIEFDSWPLGNGDPEEKHIALIQGSVYNHLVTQNENRVDDGQWHKVVVNYKAGAIVVYLDNEKVLSYEGITFADEVYVGICAATGEAYNRHLVKDFTVQSGSEADSGNTSKPEADKEKEVQKEQEQPQSQSQEQPKKILVQKITLTAQSKSIAAGKALQLAAAVTPAEASDPSVVWSVSNAKYASVSKTGKLTAKNAGAGKTVTVTAEAADGSGVKASVKVKIMKDAVKKITLSASVKAGSADVTVSKDKKTVTVKAGKSVSLKAVVETTGKSANKTLKWTSNTASVKGSLAGVFRHPCFYVCESEENNAIKLGM